MTKNKVCHIIQFTNLKQLVLRNSSEIGTDLCSKETIDKLITVDNREDRTGNRLI